MGLLIGNEGREVDEILPRPFPVSPCMFSTDLGRTSLPTRGLFYSVLFHALFVAIVVEVPWDYWMPVDVHLVTAERMQQREVLLLPTLEPMASASPAAAPSSSGDSISGQPSRAATASSKAAQGIVYKGPQLIISNPPRPDNYVQTIQQPDLAKKLKLPAPLAVPSLVSIAPAKPLLVPAAPQPAEFSHELIPEPAPPVQVAAAPPITLPREQPKVEAPKLPLPANSSDSSLRAVANAPAPAQLPKLARPNPPAKSGTDAKNILIVNALPVPPSTPAAVPAGELSGAFTVSPVPLSARPGAAKLAGGGSEINGVPDKGNGGSAGTASSAGAGPHAGAAPNAGSGTSASSGPGAGKGTHAGVGAGTGPGHGGTGHNPAATGPGGNGLQVTVSRGGSGSGAGTGNSPFSGITIQGGSGTHGIPRTPAVAESKTPNSYGITIVANGASGGGFKDFGVFQDEASYTVYLDMADTGLSISSWTLQYALYSHRLPGSSRMPQIPHGLLTPPYAITKSLPHFSSEVAKRSAGATIVVSGIVNLQGKFEDLRIMQSPDPGLNQLLLDSLAKWTLQPAKMDGAHVPVKFLLGVPVNSIPRV